MSVYTIYNIKNIGKIHTGKTSEGKLTSVILSVKCQYIHCFVIIQKTIVLIE